jgi:hypothetical protein
MAAITEEHVMLANFGATGTPSFDARMRVLAVLLTQQTKFMPITIQASGRI